MKNERSANEATTASAKSSWRIIANMRYGVFGRANDFTFIPD